MMLAVRYRDVNETRENFSVLRIVFLAVENLRLLARVSSLQSFNDGRSICDTTCWHPECESSRL